MRANLNLRNWFVRHPVIAWVTSVTLLFIVGLALGIRPRSALSRYKTELVARGEKLGWAEFVPSQTPEILRFHQTMVDLASGLVDKPIVFGALNFGGTVTNGTSIPVWQKDKPAESGAATWADLGQQLEASRPSLHALRSLITNPPPGSRYDPNNPFGNSGPSGTLIAKRRAAQAFAASTVLHLHEQKLPEAIDDLHSLIELSHLQEPAAVLVEHMIQVAISGLAHAVTWEALQSTGWTDAQLSALAANLEPKNLVTRLPRVIETERAHVIAASPIGKTNSGGILTMFAAPARSRSLSERAYGALYDAFLAEADELQYLQCHQQVLDDIRTAVATTNYTAINAAFSNAVHRSSNANTWLNRWRYPLTLTAAPNWPRAVTAVLKNETRRRMALTAIALQRHALRHNSLPASLTEISSDLLPHLPKDVLCDKSVVYQRIDSTRFRLFSPGENSQNEDGKGDDIIWAGLANSPPVTNSHAR